MLVWLKDLQSNWLSWLAVALTLVVSSTSCTLALAMLVASSGAEENPAGPLGGTVLGMALCVVVLVTLSQMRLIIAEREPVYRSWRMVGMPGWMIVAFILGQVAAVSAAAGFLGVLPARPLLDPCVRALRSDGIPMPDIAVTGQVTAIAVSVCTSAALVGALPPLRRVFRPRTPAHPMWLLVKFLLAAAAIGGTVYGCLHIDDPGDLLSAEMGLVILVALFLPWLMPGIDQWTRAAGIAGANVRVRRHFSTPHILPWVLLGGFIVAVGSGLRFGNDAGAGGTLSSWQVFVALLGPVFAPQHRGRRAYLTAHARAHRLRYPRPHAGRRHSLGLGARASRGGGVPHPDCGRRGLGAVLGDAPPTPPPAHPTGFLRPNAGRRAVVAGLRRDFWCHVYRRGRRQAGAGRLCPRRATRALKGSLRVSECGPGHC